MAISTAQQMKRKKISGRPNIVFLLNDIGFTTGTDGIAALRFSVRMLTARDKPQGG